MRTAFYSLIALLLFAGAGGAQMAVPPSGDWACVGGKPTAPIKIEVFSDFQCPACREFYLSTMRSVLSDYADPGKVCVIYREFPLSMHQHAKEAAVYGHAAQMLGQRYWAEVADALYQNQDKWEQDGKVGPIVAAALPKDDMARLTKQMQDPAVEKGIESDIAHGREIGVNQTPTFLVTAKGKTERVAGVVQYPILKRYLDSLLTP